MNTIRRGIRLVAFFLLLFVASAKATMIVVVYTSDGYWIGADSIRSGKDIGEEVCKIHQTKFGILVKAGEAQGITLSGEQYSTDKEVENVLENSQTAEEFKAQLKQQYKADIDSELAYIVNDAGVTGDNIELMRMDSAISKNVSTNVGRIILLFEPNKKEGAGEVMSVEADSELIGRDASGTFRYKYRALAREAWDPLWNIKPEVISDEGRLTFPPSVRMFAHVVQYDRPDAWVRTHPKRAIKELLRLGHGEAAKEIGPPYVMIHVTTGKSEKARWVHEHGKCPSWSERVMEDSWFQSVRNNPE